MGFIWWRFASLILHSSLDYETNTSHTRRFPDSSFPDSLHKQKNSTTHKQKTFSSSAYHRYTHLAI